MYFVRRNKRHFRPEICSVNIFCCGASKKSVYIKKLESSNFVFSSWQQYAAAGHMLNSIFALYVNVNLEGLLQRSLRIAAA